MKKSLSALVALFASVILLQAQLDLPQPSPAASVSQTVGMTKITVDYSSPAVKGRKVWGGLEKYDVAWRAGANKPTKITFDKDVQIDGNKVAAGSYALFITPKAKGNWTVHLNKDPKGNGVFSYQNQDGSQDKAALEAEDVIRVSVKPNWTRESKERLTYTIDPAEEDKGTVTMNWEKVKVSFDVKTNTVENGVKSINSKINWFTLAQSADFYVDHNQDIKTAENWIDQSLAANEHFFNHFVKSKVLAKQEKYSDAVKHLEKAHELGKENGGGFYNAFKSRIDDAIATYSKKK